MGSWKFVHAADLHLDSPLRGLSRYEGAPIDSMRAATRRALENLVALCIREEAKFLVLAGDIFDGDWKDFSTGLFFCAQMARLGRAGIDVYLVRGNHDAQSVVTKALVLPQNVHEFSSRRCQSFSIPELGVELHGRSFRDRATTENLVLGYPAATAGCLNIGVLHTSLGGGYSGHQNYAPCSIGDLVAKGYDYWALGHVHEQQVVCEDPWIAWSGCSQARHARECGPKGALLVTVEDQSILRPEFCRVDAVRWATLCCDVSSARDLGDVLALVQQDMSRLEEACEGLPLAVRVVLEGRTRAHAQLCNTTERHAMRAQVRSVAADCGDSTWIEKVSFRTRPVLDLDALSKRDDAIGGLARAIDEICESEERCKELLSLFRDLQGKLPKSVLQAEGELGFEHTAGMRALLDEVKMLLLPMLVCEEERS